MRTFSWIALLGSVALSGVFGERCAAQEKDRVTIEGADKGRVLCVVFSPDGKTLASAGQDESIKLWDVATRKKLATLEGHGGYIWSVAFRLCLMNQFSAPIGAENP